MRTKKPKEYRPTFPGELFTAHDMAYEAHVARGGPFEATVITSFRVDAMDTQGNVREFKFTRRVWRFERAEV